MSRKNFSLEFSKKLTTQNILAKNILVFILFSCIVALVFAYISQYIFGLQPCQLCLWQRQPFFAIVILAGLFLIIPQLKKYQNLAIKISVLLLLINSVIAFYHAGVEKKLFRGLDSCSSVSSESNTIEELRIALENTKAVRCDKPQFVFIGISMAGWNVLYCLGLVSAVVATGRVFRTNKV